MALPPGCVRLKVYSETQPEIRGGREYRGLSAVELLEVLACRLWWSDLFRKATALYWGVPSTLPSSFTLISGTDLDTFLGLRHFCTFSVFR